MGIVFGLYMVIISGFFIFGFEIILIMFDLGEIEIVNFIFMVFLGFV